MELSRRDVLKHTALLGAAAAAAPGLFARAQAPDGTVELPPLPYDYDALEPAIDARTMRIHHDRHHAGYTRKYNAAAPRIPGGPPVEEVLANLSEVPEDVRVPVRRNGGGYVNHSLFWEVMAPPRNGGGGDPAGDLAARLSKDFGSVAAFRDRFSKAAGGVFGSGWAWLILREADGRLAVTTTPNQDSPLMRGVVPDDEVGTPLLGLDVWEHAYYLHYQNRRGDYIANWWKVVNWPAVAARLG